VTEVTYYIGVLCTLLRKSPDTRSNIQYRVSSNFGENLKMLQTNSGMYSLYVHKKLCKKM
jgi:hypothetical protein